MFDAETKISVAKWVWPKLVWTHNEHTAVVHNKPFIITGACNEHNLHVYLHIGEKVKMYITMSTLQIGSGTYDSIEEALWVARRMYADLVDKMRAVLE